MKKKVMIENKKTFTDLTNKTWFKEENKIKYGDNFSKIMGGSVEELDVKEVLFGNQHRTWIIVITEDDKVYLLKSSRELNLNINSV